MKHALTLKGFRFSLRPAEATDAEFIVGLRTNPELGRFLHATSPKVADQEVWMAAYEQRLGDYYFVVEDDRTSEPVGTIGVYDVADGAAEWGRWLIRPGSLAAVESALLLYRIGFEQLALERLFCRTIVDNVRVLSFHDSMGAERSGVLERQFVLADGPRDAVEHRVDRARWDTLRPRLERLAQRVAET